LGDAQLRAPAQSILLATTLAVVFSMVSYYGHFAETYRTLRRVRAPIATVVASPAPSARPDDRSPVSEGASVWATLTRRIRGELTHGPRALGWPIVLLAGLGAWRLWRGGARDRLGLMVAALSLSCLGFLAFALATPVDPAFERYTWEYIDRLHCAAAPAFVLLAARGAAWAWSAGLVPRLAAAALAGAAVVQPLRLWIDWVS
jgi:hypothetical protein